MDGKIAPSGPAFSVRLEHYLRAEEPAKCSLFSDIPQELREKERSTHAALTGSDLVRFDGYRTMFAYDAHARFVTGVSEALETASAVTGVATLNATA